MIAAMIERAAGSMIKSMIIPAPIWATPADQEREAPFLTIVQALVEWVCRIGNFLQARCGLRHIVGALAQPGDGIRFLIRRRAILRTTIIRTRLIKLGATGIAFQRAGIGTIHPLLGEVAHRGLDRWPVLGLIRGQLKSGFNRRDLRIEKSGAILHAHARMVMKISVLRVHSG